MPRQLSGAQSRVAPVIPSPVNVHIPFYVNFKGVDDRFESRFITSYVGLSMVASLICPALVFAFERALSAKA